MTIPRLTYILLLSLLLFPLALAEDADDIREKGIAALKDSQSNSRVIVDAARLFVKAAELYNAAGNEEKNVEMNSFLYWCKKKMTMEDIDAFTKGGETAVTGRLASLEKLTPKADEAQKWFDLADQFAKKNPNEHLLIAIRYFEVGDRFKDTDPGRKAISASLNAMQQIGGNAKRQDYKPAPTDGKVYLQSDPAGAAILFSHEGILKDTQKKTPSIILLPKGRQTITLEFPGMNPSVIDIIVIEATINKPEIIKLEPKIVKVDVVFESGWSVFVDGKLARNPDGKRMITPCTISAPINAHDIALAKEGFKDIHQKAIIKDGIALEFKAKPLAGSSALLSSLDILPEMKPFREGINGRIVSEGTELKGKNSVRIVSEGVYSPPFKVVAVVKTDSQIRFHCGTGEIIFGWEVNAAEFRFQDILTGDAMGIKGKGNIAPNVWHTLTWIIQKDGTNVQLDGREIFTKKSNYQTFQGVVGVSSDHGLTVIVKSFSVGPITSP